MKILITGHRGFIASNLEKSFNKLGHTIVDHRKMSMPFLTNVGEPCVYKNTHSQWEREISDLGVDVVIHNAAAVGTDVVALSPNESTLTNVTGTYNITRACNAANIPIVYISTTVIYDVEKYQNSNIEESSHVAPKTLYGTLKLAGEHIVKSHANKWSIVRPLFCYGGIGDNNSLIAKTIFASLTNKTNIDMFLDKDKIKDYMHVEDFCDAVSLIPHKGLWYDDWNVAAETPFVTGKIVQMMQDVTGNDLENAVKWHPSTDYLGNHRLTTEKFRKASGWSPQISLQSGIEMSYESIKKAVKSKDDWNPLKYLDEARMKGLDLKQFFNNK